MDNLLVPLANPRPDWQAFIRAVTSDYQPPRPVLVEYLINEPVLRPIVERMGRQWVVPGPDRASRAAWLDNFIEFWLRMGYDFVRLELGMGFVGGHGRTAPDVNRTFAETAAGPIQSWEDFETYPWPDPEKADYWPYEYIAAHLPEGMGLICNHAAGVLEHISSLMGYETMCIALHEDPELVAAVSREVGWRMEAYYRRLLQIPRLIALFPGDDMGFRTGTLISPADLRKYVLPWHQRYAALAHQARLPYFLHSCGQISEIMPDLIDTVRIDAKHSFEDAIIPVSEFKRRYGQRIGVLGGVDVDKLARLEGDQLRRHVRKTIDDCLPGGRFAIGSGNSVPDYIPVENYLTFLDEVHRYGA